MRYLTIQPDTPYFHWQLEVLHNNMKEQGMFDDSVTILGYTQSPSSWALDYKRKYPKKVYLLPDTRTEFSQHYIPSLRPHLLAKLCKCVLKDHNWMYHDSDVLFTNKIDWESVIEDTNQVYLSDTISYIGSTYIESKGKQLFAEMCDIVGIDPVLVKANELSSGGAQYIFGKDVKLPTDFWVKVEADSVNLFQLMNETANIYCPEHPIQSWCADMFSLLWNIWLQNYQTKIISDLNFAWPNQPIEEVTNNNIFHNAGVTGTEPDLFYKGHFTDVAPFEYDFSYVNPDKCSYRYVEEIRKVQRIYSYGQTLHRQGF